MTAMDQSLGLHPVLHHLNADSSWLLQLPNIHARENGATKTPRRKYYNILIDPWLKGSQTDVYSWFSRQWHAEPSHVQTIQEVCNLAQAIEEPGNADAPSDNVANNIDLVVISHEFTDHCHQETLLQVESQVPVLASCKAAKLVRSWLHFDTVMQLEPASHNVVHNHLLPDKLDVFRLQKAGDALYLHAAVVVAFRSSIASNTAEQIVYTPHGIHPDTAELLNSCRPDTRTLCLVHGLHDVRLPLSQQINLGGDNGLQVYRRLHAKYWVGTHDEDKVGRGLISWVLSRKEIDVQDALQKESGIGTGDDILNRTVNFFNIPNGGKLILS